MRARCLKPVIFITARKNSQRLPNKHMAIIGGMPLIEHVIRYSIETGINSCVSTDDPEIVEVASKYKRWLLFIANRPKALCGDTFDRKLFNDHLMRKWLSVCGSDPQIIMIRMMGNALITDKMLAQRALAKMKSRDADEIHSVSPYGLADPFHSVGLDRYDRIKMLDPDYPDGERKTRYHLDGGIWMFKWPERKIAVGDKQFKSIAIKSEPQTVYHIDDKYDLRAARAMYKWRQEMGSMIECWSK